MTSNNYNIKNNSLLLFRAQNLPYLFLNKNIAKNDTHLSISKKPIPEVLFITSYPPRECGIATYSFDLMNMIQEKFGQSFSLKVCALEAENETYEYGYEVEYTIETSQKNSYNELAEKINNNKLIELVLIEHEFGLFCKQEDEFIVFLKTLQKPIAIVFHTVLPNPNESLKLNVQQIAKYVNEIVVMTNHSARILVNDYQILRNKISVIPHGTHLVPHLDKNALKEKYNLTGRKVFSTFGLLSEGKSIETTLAAMPAIIKVNPNALFLVIGKTHPVVKKEQGEKYRNILIDKVNELGLQNHVLFINQYLQLPELLEYLQLTDIYLFTSKDRNQAVSGIFSYAISCGCPIISTPIPHALEVLNNEAGMIVDFENAIQLGKAVNLLLCNDELRQNMSINGLHKITSTAWENTALSHALLFNKMIGDNVPLHFSLPDINIDHMNRLTTNFGMIQFSKINQPDIDSGYTLDDNARALIAMCMHYEISGDEEDLKLITTYFNFIKYCLKSEGYFLNYVDEKKKFTSQNYSTNLADSNGRAIWALGYLISQKNIPVELTNEAISLMSAAMTNLNRMHSTRAMAFAIKGLCYYYEKQNNLQSFLYIKLLAERLVQMYKHESSEGWEWFESYLTYGNSILPEALLMAGLATNSDEFKNVAVESFNFLLSQTFNEKGIKVISNRSWLHKGKEAANFGEQPIDVAYTILALDLFYEAFKEPSYLLKMEAAFNWFLGQNHLHQIIYNPCTGGCYDGLEETHVNLNQGAESTISYLLSRLTVKKYFSNKRKTNATKYSLINQLQSIQ